MEDKDQVDTEVETEYDSEEDQSDDQQSEETTEDTSKGLSQLVKGLQKGYTLTRQEISEIRDNIANIADSINKQTGAGEGDDEYLTTGKLRQILSQQNQEQEQRKNQADKYIEDSLAGLRAEGIVNSKKEEDELLQFALEIKEPNLSKAANIYGRIKNAKEDARKEVVKTKTRQQEGSKVGTSSKTSEGESRGVNYDDIVRGI